MNYTHFRTEKEDGGHDSKDAFRISTGDEQNHHLRPGSEFANWAKHRGASGLPGVLAGPYSAWKKWTNENSNGLPREFSPKKVKTWAEFRRKR